MGLQGQHGAIVSGPVNEKHGRRPTNPLVFQHRTFLVHEQTSNLDYNIGGMYRLFPSYAAHGV